MNATHIDTWISGKSVAVLKEDDSDRPLLILAHNVLTKEEQQSGYRALRPIAHSKPTRANATGLKAEFLPKKNGVLGSVSRIDPKHPRLAIPRDGVFGALEGRPNLAPFCRQTEYDISKLPNLKKFARLMNSYYGKLAPTQHKAQLTAVRSVNSAWTSGTAITTGTVNWCFTTFPHVDSGDYKEGLGVMVTFYVGNCPKSWLVFPKYRIAVLVEDGDVLLADVGNEVHGNTVIPEHDGYGETSGRLSCIFYFRPGLKACGTPEQEAKKRVAAANARRHGS